MLLININFNISFQQQTFAVKMLNDTCIGRSLFYIG